MRPRHPQDYCVLIEMSSTRISRPRWQSQVTDTQSRKAGEEEKPKRSCQEANALQPPVRGPHLRIPGLAQRGSFFRFVNVTTLPGGKRRMWVLSLPRYLGLL